MSLTQRRQLNRASAFHALSEQESEHLQSQFPAVPTACIPNGLELDKLQTQAQNVTPTNTFKNLDSDFVFVFMGRLHYKKGIDILINAFSKVVATHPTAKLLIAGSDFGEERMLKNLVDSLQIQNSVIWAGNVDGDTKQRVFDVADVSVLSSRSDVIGLATLEAMNNGIPIIISDQCGAEEIERSRAGVIVPLDSEQLAATMMTMIDTKETLPAMGERAKALVIDKFDAAKNTDSLVTFYRSL